MKIKTVLDANDQPYTAYVGHTKKGTEVYIDKELADQVADKEAMLAAEVLAHEEAGL